MKSNFVMLKKQFPMTKKALLFATVSSVCLSASVHAAQVYTTDVIVQGSECIGIDCTTSENFGSDTLRFKENNLRIHFDDTSGSASFPKNDWRITINDSSNGGDEYFAIEDATNNKTPFKIEANSPSSSLYVKDSGNVGVGTNSPAVQLHVKDGNSPALRLEQDGSSGFTPQTWDLAGNETNFFIRDVTNGSDLPLRIQPGAGDDALSIKSGGVGVWTWSPSARLHVKDNTDNTASFLVDTTLYDDQGTITGTSKFVIDNNGMVGVGTDSPDSNLDIEDSTPSMRFTSTGTGAGVWEMFINSNTGRFNIRDKGTSNIPFKVEPNADNNLLQIGVSASDRIDITGNLYINGVDNSTPDYVFKESYDLLSIEDHAEKMWKNSHLPHVAPAVTDGSGKSVIDVANRSQGVLEEVEIAHIYIEQLNNKIKQLEEKMAKLQTAD